MDIETKALRFEKLSLQIKKDTAEKDLLKGDIVDFMKESGKKDTGDLLPNGTIYLKSRDKIEHSDEFKSYLNTEKARVKELEKEEVANGEAEVVPNYFVEYRANS